MGPVERVLYWLLLPVTYWRMWFHNMHGIFHVLDIMRFRPMPKGLLDREHPWVTGLPPGESQTIWERNVLFCSPCADYSHLPPSRRPEDDLAIVNRIGRYMARIVSKSVEGANIPWGPKRRLPHGINYLHGAVHFSAGILVFNDFRDAVYHFTDPAFVREIRRFARQERREILLLFRDRDYDCADFADLVSFLRLALPWFSNSNGPKKHVLWGNPAPYPVVNVITGHWITDTYRLKTEINSRGLARPPAPQRTYFQQPAYRGARTHVRWPEKFLSIYTYFRIRARGERGGLFFVDRRKLRALSGLPPVSPEPPIASVFKQKTEKSETAP